MLRRAGEQVERNAALAALTQIARVDLRLLGLLWYLAERWGRVAADGHLLELPLTQEQLGGSWAPPGRR